MNFNGPQLVATAAIAYVLYVVYKREVKRAPPMNRTDTNAQKNVANFQNSIGYKYQQYYST